MWLNTVLQRIFLDFKSVPDVKSSIVDKLNTEFESIAYSSTIVVRRARRCVKDQ